MKRLLWIPALAACVATLGGCKNNKIDPEAVQVAVVKLGYGTDWLSALTKAYSEKTGIKFQITEVAGQAGNNTLDNDLRSLNSRYDLLALRPNSFYELLYRGEVVAKGNQKVPHAFEPLTDIFQAPYDGESGNNTIEKKLDPNFKEYVTFEDDYYALPWANGFQSFVRNLDVWTKCGFTADQYPRTTDELFENMETIKAKAAAAPRTDSLHNAAPMMYCAQDEYYSTIIGSWFAQYEGPEMMQNFYNGRNKNGRRGTDLFAYQGVMEALTVMDRILEPSSHYQHPDSANLSFTQMQNYFLLGDAAFCVNGTWLEVENPYVKEVDSNIDYIKIPLVSSIVNKLSKAYDDAALREMVSFVDAHPNEGDNAGLPEGVEVTDLEYVRSSRNTGSLMRTDYDHLFVVPSWAEKKPQAKEFLKYMYSDEGLNLFYKTMDGHHLPATPSTGSYDDNGVKFTRFRRSANKFLEENRFCPYLINTVKDRIFSVAHVQSNFSNSIAWKGNCISWLTAFPTAANPRKTPIEIVNENTHYMTQNWSSIENAIGRED